MGATVAWDTYYVYVVEHGRSILGFYMRVLVGTSQSTEDPES